MQFTYPYLSLAPLLWYAFFHSCNSFGTTSSSLLRTSLPLGTCLSYNTHARTLQLPLADLSLCCFLLTPLSFLSRFPHHRYSSRSFFVASYFAVIKFRMISLAIYIKPFSPAFSFLHRCTRRYWRSSTICAVRPACVAAVPARKYVLGQRRHSFSSTSVTSKLCVADATEVVARGGASLCVR